MKVDYLLKISNLLKQKNISQIELARIVGKSANTVSNYFIGKTKIDIDTLLKIAEVLGVSASVFFEDEKKESNTEDSKKLWQIFKDLSKYDNGIIETLNNLISNISGIETEKNYDKIKFEILGKIMQSGVILRYKDLEEEEIQLLIKYGMLSKKIKDVMDVMQMIEEKIENNKK